MADQAVSSGSVNSDPVSNTLLEMRKRYMRTLNNMEAAVHHRQFLTSCKRDKLMPRGLRLEINLNVIGSDSDALHANVDKAIRTAEKKILNLVIEYYSTLGDKLKKDLDAIKMEIDSQLELAEDPETAETHAQQMAFTDTRADIRVAERETTRRRKLHALKREKQSSETLRSKKRPSRPMRDTHQRRAPSRSMSRGHRRDTGNHQPRDQASNHMTRSRSTHRDHAPQHTAHGSGSGPTYRNRHPHHDGHRSGTHQDRPRWGSRQQNFQEGTRSPNRPEPRPEFPPDDRATAFLRILRPFLNQEYQNLVETLLGS